MCRLRFFVFLFQFLCAFNLKSAYSHEYTPTFCWDIDCNVTQDAVEKEICSDPRYCFGYRDTFKSIDGIYRIDKKIAYEKYKEFRSVIKNYANSDHVMRCVEEGSDRTVEQCIYICLRGDLEDIRIDTAHLWSGMRGAYAGGDRYVSVNSNGVILYASYSGRNITRKEQEEVCPYIKQNFADKKQQDTMSAEEAGVNLSDFKKAYVASMKQFEEHDPDAKPYFSLIDYDNDGVDNLIYKMAYRVTKDSLSLQKKYYEYDKKENKAKQIFYNGFELIFPSVPSRIGDIFFLKYNGTYYAVSAVVMERKPRRYGEDFLVDPDRLLDPEYWGDDVRPYEVYKISKTGKKDVLCHFKVFP